MKILHIITSLENGGAENTLYKICKFDKNNEHIVISLKGSGKYFSLLKKMDIKVNRLNIRFYSFNKFFSLSCAFAKVFKMCFRHLCHNSSQLHLHLLAFEVM